MKIPKKIVLIGRAIDIIKNNNLCDEKNLYGEARYNKSQIIYQDECNGEKRKQDAIDITVLHEITHLMLWILDYNSLRDDENFVGRFSELLYQVINQIEG